MAGFPLLPPTAAELAVQDDRLMGFAVGVAVFFTALIAGLILYFVARYHHSVKADRSSPPVTNVPLEIAWVAVPLAILLTLFVWGSRLYLRHYSPPPGALEITVVGRQWMWKGQHPGGQREINELHVPVGRAVRLVMSSQDVIHSLFVPAFRVKQDVLPGRFTSVWFKATMLGRFRLFCAQYCGTLHSGMRGDVVVVTEADYQRWLAQTTPAPTLADEGGRLFTRMGCVGCHGAARHLAPPLAGLFGSRVRLSDGREVEADEEYIRESIVDPRAKVVAGYRPIMPTFRGQLSAEALAQLVSYIKSRPAP